MVQILHLELILVLLTVLYPERITPQRFRDRMYRPAYFSSEESFEMSSESSEEGYRGWRGQVEQGDWRGPTSNRLYYERFAKYAIVGEEYIRPLIEFGSFFLLTMDLHFFGTFAGVKYYTIKENHGLNENNILRDGVIVNENRLRQLYNSGKAPRRLPLLYMGKRQYEDIFMIDKSYLDASTGSQGPKTKTSIPTVTTTGAGTSRTATVPSRDGGIPGRDRANVSRFSRLLLR